jgi:hypothetical protein
MAPLPLGLLASKPVLLYLGSHAFKVGAVVAVRTYGVGRTYRRLVESTRRMVPGAFGFPRSTWHRHPPHQYPQRWLFCNSTAVCCADSADVRCGLNLRAVCAGAG